MNNYNRNLIVYQITYLPWIDNVDHKPWLYIGSTSQPIESYFGSVGSKKYKKFWKDEVKTNPQNFKKEILFNCIYGDRKTLLEVEAEIQKELNVVADEKYFNMSFANSKGCCGLSMTGAKNPNWGNTMNEEQKKHHSIVLTEVGKKPEVKKRRSDAQKRINTLEYREAKRQKQIDAWKDPTSNLKNSKKSFFPPRRVHLKDFSFVSVKELRNFLKENVIGEQYISMVDDEWSIEDLMISKRIDEFVNKTKVKLSGIRKILEISSNNPTMNDIEIMNLVETETYVVIRAIKKKFNGKLEELINLINIIESSNNPALQKRVK